MLHAKLVREGFRVNVKVVERLYREERLWLRRTKRKKIPREGREGAWCPIAPNQRWSLDFTSDALANGRKFRTANLKDDCTRECPAIEVDFSLPGDRVVEMLERVARERGYPDILVVDNGPELRGRALDGWADDHGVQLYFIDPGKPTQNAYIESFVSGVWLPPFTVLLAMRGRSCGKAGSAFRNVCNKCVSQIARCGDLCVRAAALAG